MTQSGLVAGSADLVVISFTMRNMTWAYAAFLFVVIFGSAAKAADLYHVQIANFDTGQISAELDVRTGELVMETGDPVDFRSSHIQHIRATNLAGQELPLRYDSDHATWHLASTKPQRIKLSYSVDLKALRSLPNSAHLQYGFFDASALYLACKSLFIAPDSTASADQAEVDFSLAPGMGLAAPWPQQGANRTFHATVAALVNNVMVVGKFSQASYSVSGFDIQAVIMGDWASHQNQIALLIKNALVADTKLFPGTPPAHYLVVLASGDEDGQSFTTSNSISTRLPIMAGDTEIWANNIVHEFFHHWNARLIHSDDSRTAFFVEGFTEYYANREILAQKLIDPNRYWAMAALHLGAYSYFHYSPNYRVSIADAGANKTKNRFGIYDAGWTTALCLDLELRRDGHSLDDVMRLMWRRFGLTARTFTLDDLIAATSDVAGRDMRPFFTQYVIGTAELPFREDLARIGVSAFDQPFGGEAYIRVGPDTAERPGYRQFIAP